MTIAKLPEQRQPHGKILDLLVPDCEDLPFTSEETLKFCFEVDDFEVVREALSDLTREGSIISRLNPRSGKEYALAEFEEQIKAEENDYEALKARVRVSAEKHGLRTKWHERDGWKLVTLAGKTVARGNMRELEEYLQGIDANAEKSAA